jgi:ABC-2 type transport system permease protein
LTARLIRRGTIAIAVGVGLLMALEALAFTQGYPDEASRAALTMWGRDPGIRMLSGQPIAVETVGGFAVWDAGLYLTLILGAWALTTATRVLRGDEDHGRADLLLAGPIRSGRALAAQFLVLSGACALAGSAVSLGLAASGAQVWGAVLFGALMIGYCAVLVGLAGLACQVFPARVGALAVSASLLVGWMLLRMVSNSADARAWLGWLTPTGWIDQLRAFGENRWWVLLVPLAVAAVLMATAVALRERRDSGAGLVAGRERHRSRAWGLGSPLGFAWRSHLGVLLAWGAGVAIAALVVGAMLRTVDDFLANDPGFIDLLATMGMEVSDLTGGFISMWAIILGLVIAVFAAFRMGATRAEEASTRAEFLLTRSVRRWRWLGGHVLCLAVSVLVLSLVAATALWLGGIATGAQLTPGDAFAATFNALPVVTVFAGLSVLVFGIAPRLTVVVGASAAVVAYVLELVGPILQWPEWVVAMSPFHHLAAVPVDPFGLPAAIVMVAVGVVLAGAGIVAFESRDLVGA